MNTKFLARLFSKDCGAAGTPSEPSPPPSAATGPSESDKAFRDSWASWRQFFQQCRRYGVREVTLSGWAYLKLARVIQRRNEEFADVFGKENHCELRWLTDRQILAGRRLSGLTFRGVQIRLDPDAFIPSEDELIDQMMRF